MILDYTDNFKTNLFGEDGGESGRNKIIVCLKFHSDKD